MIRTIMLSLLILFAATSAVHAAEGDFSERKANLTEISAFRVGYGNGMVRIVLDIGKEVEYTESYAEYPSRMIIDFKNTWLNPTVQRELTLKSVVATKMRLAQFNPTTVRLVVESMAETKLFFLDGGPKGKRFVMDLGRNEPVKKSDIDKKNQEDAWQQQERELEERRQREIKEREERELKEREERELKERQERELKERQERELKERQEREEKERELKEKQERELKKKQERELKKQKEREEKERREREKKEKRDKKSKDKDKDKQQPVTEVDKDLNEITALSGKRIVIDPGHGGNDAGAIGPTGVMEKNVTLNVSLELKKLLEAEGAQVILTRYDDSTVSPKGAAASDIEELGARCDVANRVGAEIFISIHADAFTRPEARGTTGYYYSKSTTGRGQRLADCIRRNLVEQLGTPRRGTQPCNFYVVKNTDMPATLIELGFISNKDEEKLLGSEDGVKRAAQGILDGIEDYFG